MKKLLLIPLLLLSLNGCAGVSTQPSTPATAVANAQVAAEQSLYALGAVLVSVPKIIDALYNAGKISNQDYNKIADVYNKSLASYNLAVNALKAAIDAGKDPNQVTTYLTALNGFILDKNNIDNLLVAMGQQPIGMGVK